jgi:hypothetical protein
LGVSWEGEFKNPSGLITKYKTMRLFLLRFFFSSLVVLLDFFNRVLGRFATKGVQKHDKKKSQNFFRSRQKM